MPPAKDASDGPASTKGGSSDARAIPIFIIHYPLSRCLDEAVPTDADANEKRPNDDDDSDRSSDAGSSDDEDCRDMTGRIYTKAGIEVSCWTLYYWLLIAATWRLLRWSET